MKLKIAHVTATFPPYGGGTGNVCYYHARELARSGHAVHVFTADKPGARSHEVQEHFTVHRLRPLAQIGNAPVLPQVVTALRGFDVLHLHYPFILGAELVRLASVRYRTPLIISFHNDLLGLGLRRRLFQVYQQLSARFTVRGAAQLCAVSIDHYENSLLRQSLTARQPPVLELPNGVATEQFCPDSSTNTIRDQFHIPAEAKLILFVAALDRAHHFKGLGYLLEALHNLPSDVHLLVVGDGDLRRSYEQQAAALGITDRIVFAGAIRHGDTPAFYRVADLTVLPSSPPESFGLVLIESLACGTPVVASNIPGVRTVVDHGQDGLLVPPNNPDALCEAILTILGDKAAHQEMARYGRVKVVAHYSWERIGARLDLIYRSVLERSTLRSDVQLSGEQ
jgi:glycosyltransferase involved in cell wall biosynthesis